MVSRQQVRPERLRWNQHPAVEGQRSGETGSGERHLVPATPCLFLWFHSKCCFLAAVWVVSDRDADQQLHFPELSNAGCFSEWAALFCTALALGPPQHCNSGPVCQELQLHCCQMHWRMLTEATITLNKYAGQPIGTSTLVEKEVLKNSNKKTSLFLSLNHPKFLTNYFDIFVRTVLTEFHNMSDK